MVDVPIQIKDALRESNYRADYEIEVITNEHLEYIYTEEFDGSITGGHYVNVYDTEFVIDNNNLVSESVRIDERLCSENTIKFGLCEGSSIEFKYFDKPNILHKRVAVSVVIKSQGRSYPIVIGFFEISSVSREASTGIFKATGFNKLKSKYLNSKINESLIEAVKQGTAGSKNKLNLLVLSSRMLSDYTIMQDYELLAPWAYDTVNMYDQKALFSNPNGHIRVGELRADGRLYVDNFQSNNYYRVYLNCERIFSMLDELIPASIQDLLLSYAPDPPTYKTIHEYLLTHPYIQPKLYIYIEEEGEQTSIAVNIAEESENSDYYTDWFTNVRTDLGYFLMFSMPILWKSVEFPSSPTEAPRLDSFITQEEANQQQKWFKENICLNTGVLQLQQLTPEGIENIEITTEQAESFADVTLRDLQTAMLETQCQFGKLDKITDLFKNEELNQSRLYPQETLYPSASLYPDGAVLSANKAMYSKLWADEGNVQKWRYLIITYQGTDGNEHTLQRTVNNDGTQNYNCSDNWLFRNLQWTAEQIGVYADAMVLKMRNITWFPFEMWCAGLPHLETGDEIEIPLGEDTYTSYILQRNLNGIQNLQDTFINGELDIF